MDKNRPVHGKCTRRFLLVVRLAAHVSIYEAVAGEDWAGLGEEGEI